MRVDADVGGDPFQVGDAGRTADVREQRRGRRGAVVALFADR